MSRCMCCSSKYECGCTDIQQSVIDLANANQDISMNKLDIELLNKEIAQLKEQLKLARGIIDSIGSCQIYGYDHDDSALELLKDKAEEFLSQQKIKI